MVIFHIKIYTFFVNKFMGVWINYSTTFHKFIEIIVNYDAMFYRSYAGVGEKFTRYMPTLNVY